MKINIVEVSEVRHGPFTETQLKDGRYELARPLGVSLFQRIKAAWLVLTNKACALRWY